MNRRKFMSITTLTAIGWSTVPLNAEAWVSIGKKGKLLSKLEDTKDIKDIKDIKEEIVILPKKAKIINDPWKVESIKEVIEILYGKDKELTKSDKVKIKVPKLAENQYSIPLNIKTTIDTKKILILQSPNKHVLTGVFEIPKDALVNYSLYVKQRQTGYLTVLIEDINGLLYTNSFEIDVASGGGCGG